MKLRTIKSRVTCYPTEDGAGVSLVRVLGNSTTAEFDPVLMLDSFDSTDPSKYTAGFPMHPHRGIETVSYVYRGRMLHRDSLGNEDEISDGEVQWMTAGSGILHEEALPASERLLGVQLWLNLPAAEKMTAPAYHSIKRDAIPEIDLEGGKLRLLAGHYGEHTGYLSEHLPVDYYDIHLNPGSEFRVETDPSRSVMLFTLVGGVEISGSAVKEKTAVKLTEGDYVTIKNGEQPAQVLFISSAALGEPVAWSGPIVMNTAEELKQAFADLRSGKFLRDKMSYDN